MKLKVNFKLKKRGSFIVEQIEPNDGSQMGMKYSIFHSMNTIKTEVGFYKDGEYKIWKEI